MLLQPKTRHEVMLVQQAQQLGESQLEQRGMSVRRLWSGEERLQRRIVALERQQLLFKMLNSETSKHSQNLLRVPTSNQ